jgi:hypothetical protein
MILAPAASVRLNTDGDPVLSPGLETLIRDSSTGYGIVLLVLLLAILLSSAAGREFGRRPRGRVRNTVIAAFLLLLTAFAAVVVTRFLVLA